MRIHDGEVEIDAELVGRLVAEQFPHWAELPISWIATSGTVHVLFRLGDELCVRLPRDGGPGDAAKERRWLPLLASRLPVTIPEIVGEGEPTPEYPGRWSIYRWIEGRAPDPDHLVRPTELAEDLAAFVMTLRTVDLPGAPTAPRGAPLRRLDRQTRAALADLARLKVPFDVREAEKAWDEALAVPDAPAPLVWVHADLMPGNLLLRDNRLHAVLDFGCIGLGDPACDLMPAWNLLTTQTRSHFRQALNVDDATWARGRGRALWMALNLLPYYRDRSPVLAANARRTIQEILTDRHSGT